MSSDILNIGGIRPYEAETIDARLERRRREQQANSNSNHDKSDARFDEEDGQVLSVKALILFLEDFLEANIGLEKQSIEQKSDNSFAKWFNKTPSNLNDAAKAYAYGSKIARRGRKVRAEVNHVKIPNLSHIYGLIVDLRSLERKGVRVLRLKPDTNFIDGISQVVDVVKSG